MSGPPLPVPPSLARLERRALFVAGVGLALSAVGFFTNPAQFYRSYLFGYLFWIGVAIGSLSILLLSHVTGGMWGLVIRRVLEAGTRTLPYMAVLFLPVAFGVTRLYSWTSPSDDPVLIHKAAYLNVPFFLGRTGFYFAVWLLLAHFANRWSLESDKGESPLLSQRLQGISAAGLVLLGLTITFSSVDWAMSLSPTWFSTIYGIWFMVGQALSALSLAIVVVALLSAERPMADAVRPGTLHDLGKLLFAFTMLWAYIHLSQFLIVWSGNLAEETPFYLHRTQGGWQHVGTLLIVFHFALPFLLLLSRDVKRNPKVLGTIAAFMLAFRVVDLYWIVGPDLVGHGLIDVPLRPHWLDLTLPLGLGGLWLYLLTRGLRTRPLLPVGEPELRELLEARAEASAS